MSNIRGQGPDVETQAPFPDGALNADCMAIPADGVLYGNRKHACSFKEYTYVVFNLRTAQVDGFLPFNIRTGLVTSHRSGEFIQVYRFDFGPAYGNVHSPQLDYILALGGTTDPSKYSVSGFNSGASIQPNTSREITVTWKEQPLADAVGVGFRLTEMQFRFSNAEPDVVATSYSKVTVDDVRCDKTMRNSQGYKQGCVFPVYVGGVDYRGPYGGADIPQAVGHIQAAAGAGLPGTSLSRPLHRIASVDDRNANRAIACPRTASIANPRKVPGRSCDEYPFASTREGAASGGPGRTFNPNCHVPDLQSSGSSTGYSVCMIDASQNNLGGSKLGVFYGQGRYIDGDAFFVDASGGALPPPP